jgi:hypothetical protein
MVAGRAAQAGPAEPRPGHRVGRVFPASGGASPPCRLPIPAARRGRRQAGRSAVGDAGEARRSSSTGPPARPPRSRRSAPPARRTPRPGPCGSGSRSRRLPRTRQRLAGCPERAGRRKGGAPLLFGIAVRRAWRKAAAWPGRRPPPTGSNRVANRIAVWRLRTGRDDRGCTARPGQGERRPGRPGAAGGPGTPRRGDADLPRVASCSAAVRYHVPSWCRSGSRRVRRGDSVARRWRPGAGQATPMRPLRLP